MFFFPELSATTFLLVLHELGEPIDMLCSPCPFVTMLPEILSISKK